MAFPRWPGDVRLPSAAADTYFIAQALRAGYPVDPIARPDLATPPPFSAWEVLQWEMQEERIREAYLSRELVHSRLLLDQHMRHHNEIEAAHRSKPAVRSRHSVIIKQRPVGQGAAREHESIMLKKASGIESKWTCSICQVFATSEHDLKVHLNGRRHKVNQESLFCDVCKVRCTSQTMLDSHLNGKRHKKASVILSAKETCTSKEVIAPLPVKEQKQEVQKSSLNCDVCNLKCNSKFVLNEHLNGKKHMRHIKAQGDKPVSAEPNKLANDKQPGNALDGEPVIAEGLQLANDKPVTAEQIGEDKSRVTTDSSGQGGKSVTAEQTGEDKSRVITDSSGQDSSVTAAKRRAVKKARRQVAVYLLLGIS